MFRLICRVLLLGVLLLPLWGTASLSLAGGKIVPLKFPHQWKVHYHTTLIRGPLTDSKMVIRDAAAWSELVDKHADLGKLNVDFSKQMVLVYAEKPQGRGKHLGFVTVQDVGNELRAVFHFRLDFKGKQLQDIIFPNHFVVVDRSEKPVQFIDELHPELELREQILPAANSQILPIPPAKGQPKLEFKVDGADLIVTTKVTANNSPHVLQTSYYVNSKQEVQLKYILIQNTDLLVRSQKKVQVTWRLKGMAALPAPANLSFHVEPTNLTLSSAELGVLIPQLDQLKQTGDMVNKAAGKVAVK